MTVPLANDLSTDSVPAKLPQRTSNQGRLSLRGASMIRGDSLEAQTTAAPCTTHTRTYDLRERRLPLFAEKKKKKLGAKAVDSLMPESFAICGQAAQPAAGERKPL
jgi:hypothetical protein